MNGRERRLGIKLNGQAYVVYKVTYKDILLALTYISNFITSLVFRRVMVMKTQGFHYGPTYNICSKLESLPDER
jgi:hypothetical protein